MGIAPITLCLVRPAPELLEMIQIADDSNLHAEARQFAYPDCDFMHGDINGDGYVNTFDTLSGVKGRPATSTHLSD